MELYEKCYQFTLAREAQKGGYYPYFLPLTDTEGTEVTINGRTLIMIGSNNYLGLTTHPMVREAAIEAVRQYGLLAVPMKTLCRQDCGGISQDRAAETTSETASATDPRWYRLSELKKK